MKIDNEENSGKTQCFQTEGGKWGKPKPLYSKCIHKLHNFIKIQNGCPYANYFDFAEYF